jgi:hypothetical protein
MLIFDLQVIQVPIIVLISHPYNHHHEDNHLDPCLQMERAHGTMDVFEEIPETSGRHHVPPTPLPQAPVALDQLLATQNALM